MLLFGPFTHDNATSRLRRRELRSDSMVDIPGNGPSGR